MVTKEDLYAALCERHGAAVQERLSRASVGVAGLGGLGSHIAVHLARLGVGRLILVDFDVVELTNLHRQHYTLQSVGLPKTLALQEQLEQINPYITYETHTERIVPANAARLFAGCDVVCEALDRAPQKAMLVEALLSGLPAVSIVSASGMAGYGPANTIRTTQPFSRLTLCGDGESDVSACSGLFAPRVALCAAQQSLAVLRLLLGEAAP